jgi:hypothetical protein
MIFKRFLRPKRPAPDAAETQASLSRIARESWDVAARRDACRGLARLADLRGIAADDSNAGVRDIAAARYRNLLCGNDEPHIPLEERLAELCQATDERVIAAVATGAREPELRHAAIERATSAKVLASCALRDPLSTNRQAAVERLTDKSALEQVTRQIGKKDKRVYRLAREKLRAIAEAEALPLKIHQQGSELCEKMERLGRHGNWEQDRGLLDLIEQDWASIATEVEEALCHRYLSARERFLAGYDAHREGNAQQLAAAQDHAERKAALQTLIVEITAGSQLDDASAVQALRERAERQWQEGRATLPATERTDLDKQLDQALAGLMRHAEQLTQRRRSRARAATLHETITHLLDQPEPLNLPRTKALATEAGRLVAEGHSDRELAQRLEEAATRLAQRSEKQRQHVEQRLSQLPSKLEALGRALDDGELKRAEPLLQSLQACIDLAQASGLPKHAFADAEQQIGLAAPRIKELQGWRRWGADRQREALCEAVEALNDSDTPPDALADRLRELRQSWKALDQSGAPADHRRWERFQSAAENVYERCRPFLEQQAAEREANRRAREELCEELEQFLAQVDWERMDWKKAVKAAREMRRSWATIGPPEGRHRKVLERRFRAAIKQLDRRLETERAASRRFREALIAEVEALVAEPSLERAIEAAKDCQRRWHTTVAGRKADENALWQRFRDACDAVFDRRRVQLEARETELQDNLATRAAVCDEAQSLTKAQLPPQQIEASLEELEQRWRETASLPVPRAAAQGLDRRWRGARQQVLDRLRQTRDAARRASLDLLARQAELCTRIEQATIDGEGAGLDLAPIKSAWSDLPRQDDEALQTAIGARFATALAMLEHGKSISPELIRENDEEREALCLQLEIIAQIDSPAELANERLAFQVTRLAERMEAGEKDPLATSAAGLLTKWYLCGPCSAAPNLEQRFARAREAIDRSREREADEAA